MKSLISVSLLSFGVWPLACVAVSLPNPEPVDIEYMRKHHRLTSLNEGPKPLGPIALHRAYHKHGIPVSAELVRAADAASKIPKGAGVATGANNPPDNGWLFPVTMGKSKNLAMVFDTGSSDLWAFSTLTPASQRGSHKIYDPTATGKRVNGDTFDVTYGKGAASGVVYADKVVAGGITATAAVGAATSVAAFNTASTNDGIMGFAFVNQNTCYPKQCNPWWIQAASQWPQPIWGVALRHNGLATWDLGFIDKSLYTGSITYTEQMNEPYTGSWGIFVQGFSTGNNAQTKENFYALADTGTTLVLIFDDALNAYYSKVSGAKYDATQQGVVFPCSSTLPNFNLFIDGQMRTMPGSYANYARINSTYCYGGIQTQGSSPITILGDVFLKSQYVIYNPLTNVVGFAQQKGVAI